MDGPTSRDVPPETFESPDINVKSALMFEAGQSPDAGAEGALPLSGAVRGKGRETCDPLPVGAASARGPGGNDNRRQTVGSACFNHFYRQVIKRTVSSESPGSDFESMVTMATRRPTTELQEDPRAHMLSSVSCCSD